MKQFPILWQGTRDTRDMEEVGCPREMPWELFAPHERQALTNHGQTLARLAERGGLSPREAVAVLTDKSWKEVRHLSERFAAQILVRIMNEPEWLLEEGGGV